MGGAEQRHTYMRARKNSKDAAERLCSILENLEGTSAEDLRSILLTLSPDADEKEQAFIQHLFSMRRDLEEPADAPSPQAEGGEVALRGLISEARKLGLSVGDLADFTGLSPALMKILDMRLARYPTIPTQVVEDIAKVIRRSIEQVSHYLQGSPARTAVAYSDQDHIAADLPEQQDFFDVVRTDTTLSEERRARLLELGTR